MAARYHLDCTCGKRLTVEPRQAGSQVTCDCGAKLEVPTLRGLQALPPAESGPETSAAAWTLRQAVVTAGVLLGLVLFGMGLWIWRQERDIQEYRASLELNAESIAKMDADVAENLDRMKPIELWQYWEHHFKPNTRQGFVDFRAPEKQGSAQLLQWKRTERWVWWGAAAAVLAGVLLWAALAPRRQVAG